MSYYLPLACLTLAQFRWKLNGVVAKPNAELWSSQIAELSSQYSHAIESHGYIVAKQYNCFAYAFGLTESQAYNEIVQKSATVRITGHFVRLYLPPDTLVPAETPAPNDIVIYYYSGLPWHAAIYEGGDMVRSKWGDGPVFTHRILEVPMDYGSPRPFKVPPRELVEEAFISYARERHVDI